MDGIDKRHHWKSSTILDTISKIHFKLLQLFHDRKSCIWAAICYVVSIWASKNLYKKHLVMCLFDLRFPFDINNPFGYLVAFTLQYIVFACMFINIACFASTGIGSWMFAIAYTKDIRNVLNQIDGIAENPKNQTEIKEKLSEFIVQHSLGKKLSHIMLYLMN